MIITFEIDIILLAAKEAELQTMMSRMCTKPGEKFGLKINKHKTGVMKSLEIRQQ